MTINFPKKNLAYFEDTYQNISHQIDAVVAEGLSIFNIDELECIISKVSLCLTRTSFFSEEIKDYLDQLQLLKTIAPSDFSVDELHCMEASLQKLYNSCLSSTFTLHHLNSLLKVKQVSIELFDRHSPTNLPSEAKHFVRLLKDGKSLEDQDFLGEGQFGIVYRSSIGETSLAKKTIRPTKHQNRDFFDPDKLEREAALLMGMNHPNIVKIAASALSPPALYMIEVNRNSLASCMKWNVIHIPQNFLSIFEGVSSALEYLHGHMKLSHCDLHLGNILVKEHNQKFTGVLTDFEFSSQKEKSFATKGNIYTQAPETLFAHPHIRDPFLNHSRIKRASILDHKGPQAHEIAKNQDEECLSFLVQPITEQNDIWALGTCIFATLACGKGPYEIDRSKEKNLLKSAVKLHNPNLLIQHLKKSKPRQLYCGSTLDHQDPLAIDLIHNVISRCFQVNQDNRPKASQLHQYFKGKLIETQAIQALSSVEID